MNLASNAASVLWTTPSRVAATQSRMGCRAQRCTSLSTSPVFGFEPAPIERLGRDAELDDKVLGQIHRLDLASRLLPKAHEGSFVAAHDDSRIGAADEGQPIGNAKPCSL